MSKGEISLLIPGISGNYFGSNFFYCWLSNGEAPATGLSNGEAAATGLSNGEAPG